MRLSQSIKSISYLQTHTARIIRDLCVSRGAVVITQNGEARVVVQDIATYEQTRESLALLKMLAQSSQSVKAGRHKPLDRAFRGISAKTKERS